MGNAQPNEKRSAKLVHEGEDPVGGACADESSAAEGVGAVHGQKRRGAPSVLREKRGRGPIRRKEPSDGGQRRRADAEEVRLKGYQGRPRKEEATLRRRE